MVFAFLYLSFVAALVAAANDWSQPCFNGECEYDLPSNPGGPSGTLKIWGPKHLISDITPAAGWAIIDCDPDKLKQNVRLVCEEGSADHCGRLSGGLETVGDASVGRIVRLPEECGGNAFGVVTKAWVPENQTIPAHFVSRLTRRDGTLPTVQALSLGVNFSAVPAPTDPQDHVSFAIQGANVQGAAGNMTRPPLAGGNGLQGRGLRDWLNGVINGIKHLNEWNIDNQKQLSALDINRSFNVFDHSISCPPLTTGIRMDVNAKAHAAVAVGVVAMGTFLPPKIDDMALVSTLNANLDGELDLKASIGGQISTGQIPLYELGIPGLNFPGILSVGPKFEINAEATASLELAVDVKVGVHYKVDKASFTFPPKAGHTGMFDLGDTPLTLTATPGISASGVISAHVVPRVVFGISALKDSIKADVFIDLDASASMTLKMEASAPQEIPTVSHARRSIGHHYSHNARHARVFGRALAASPIPIQESPDGKLSVSVPVNPVPPPKPLDSKPTSSSPVPTSPSNMAVAPSNNSSTGAAKDPAPGAAPLEAGGCFDIDVGFDVNAGAEGSFFNIFDASTSVKLFTKHWSLYKQCFGSQASQSKARRSLSDLNALGSRDIRTSLNVRTSKPAMFNLKCSTSNSTSKPQEFINEILKESSVKRRALAHALY